MSKADDLKNRLTQRPKAEESVYDHFLPPAQTDANDNPNVNASDSETVSVNITDVPVAKPKKGIRETHTTKAFYIRNDIAELINEDIRNSRRGAMTEIANALFEQYYRSLGRLK